MIIHMILPFQSVSPIIYVASGIISSAYLSYVYLYSVHDMSEVGIFFDFGHNLQIFVGDKKLSSL